MTIENNLLVAKLGCNEEESCFQDAHRSGYWHRVEILQLQLLDYLLVHFHRNFKDITLFCLNQKEEHGLGPVGCRTNEDHSSFRIV